MLNRTSQVVAVLIGLGAFSVGASAARADGWSCNAIAKKGTCTEYPASSKTVAEAGGAEKMSGICGKQGGTWSSDACPPAGELGSCKGDRATVHAYNPKAAEGNKKVCVAPKVWTGK